MRWPVVPFCEAQLRDIKPQDILHACFRKCNTDKTKLYDRFGDITEKRFNKRYNNQFIVQLRGCPFDCYYCYVTTEGVWGEPLFYDSKEMIYHFLNSGCDTFHLMGGAPAIYLDQWKLLLDSFDSSFLFHSDILLMEQLYSKTTLRQLSKYNNSIYAISIKGTTALDYYRNTRKKPNWELIRENLKRIVGSGINYYVTFTNVDRIHYDNMLTWLHNLKVNLTDCFKIDVINYKSLEA